MARRPFSIDEALAALKDHGSEKNREGMARFGISVHHALGVSVPNIRAVAAGIEHDHALAQALWVSAIHEARILASLVDKPQWVTTAQMDAWTADFDSWDVCDQVCGNLWDRTPYAVEKIRLWAGDEREFVRRAAFATIAWMAVHDKKADDALFLDLLGLIRDAASDQRNFVRKAVNWALRQTGKRSATLLGPCLALAAELAASPDKTARWIGSDAVRELEAKRQR